MKVTYEFDLREFKAWSGGSDTLEKIREFDLTHPGAMDVAQRYMEECFCGDAASETEINDMLWFEDGAILDAIGYCEEGEEDEDGFEVEEL